MPRIPCLRALQALNHGLAPVATPARVQFASISTTAPARDLRSKLWKGEAPGPEDPYTQRSEPEQESLPSERRPAPASSARSASGIVLPPRRTEAVSEKDATHNDPTYTPATSIEDLMVAPSLKSWWEQPGHWGDESRFTGFAKAGKVVDRALVEVHLRRAVVEVLALQQAGKLSEWATKKWTVGDANAVLDISIDVAEDGTASLKTDGSALVEQLTAPEEEATSTKSVSSKKAYDAQEWDSKWQDIVLNDEVKFALRKRLYQLTGNLVSDAKLGPIRTVKHLLAVASKQPKPTKLAELLETRKDVSQLQNLKVHGRRVTPIDKEQAVGRWKVIKEELEKRGLPVTGTGGLPGHKERDWIRQDA